MKNILFTLAFLLMAAVVFAQPNNQINFQGVARDANGLIRGRPITLKISLLEGSATGSPVWVEQNTTTPNTFGVFAYAIGSGTPQGAYVFNNIDWSTKKFAKIEIDPSAFESLRRNERVLMFRNSESCQNSAAGNLRNSLIAVGESV